MDHAAFYLFNTLYETNNSKFQETIKSSRYLSSNEVTKWDQSAPRQISIPSSDCLAKTFYLHFNVMDD